MSGPSLKSLKKRGYRAKHRERYYQSTFISEYIQRKYTAIDDEADQFYQKLHQLHPKKTKLSTCTQFKVWEESLKQDFTTLQTTNNFNKESLKQDSITMQTTNNFNKESLKQNSGTIQTTNNFNINIELMNPEEVQLKKDMIMFEEIQSSLTEQINPEIVDEIIRELNQCPITNDIFDNNDIFDINDDDEEMNNLINSAIEDDLNQMSELEKELLNY